MALFKILKGQEAKLPTQKTEGWAYVTTDEGNMYVDVSSTKRVRIGAHADIADEAAKATGDTDTIRNTYVSSVAKKSNSDYIFTVTKGSGSSNDVSLKFAAGDSCGGSALKSNTINVIDVRGTNWAPNSDTFADKSAKFIFNSTGTPTSTWYSGMHIEGWTKKDYQAWELVSGASTSLNGKLYYRNGIGDTWQSWKEIAFTDGTIERAKKDGNGQTITTTYMQYPLTISDETITMKRGDGASSTITIPDAKVTQSNTTTSSYRPVVLGLTYDSDPANLAATIRGQVYVTTKFYASPDKGILIAPEFKGKLTGKADTAGTADYASKAVGDSGTIRSTYVSSVTKNGVKVVVKKGDGGETSFQLDFLPLAGGTMTGNVTFNNETQSIYKIARKKNGGGGWAYAPIRFTGSDNATFANIGAFGSGNTFNYLYIGAGDYDAATNLRIYPSGNVSAKKFIGALEGTADYATKATGDTNSIRSTYVNSVALKNGSNYIIEVKKGDGASNEVKPLFAASSSCGGPAFSANIVNVLGSKGGNVTTTGTYTKFATVDVSAGAWVGNSIFLFVSDTEGNNVHGLMRIHFRSSSTIATTTIDMKWLSLSNRSYAGDMYAVKTANGKFDLYWYNRSNYMSLSFSVIKAGSYNFSFVTNSTVSSITSVAQSSLGGQVAYASSSATADKASGDSDTIRNTYIAQIKQITSNGTSFTFRGISGAGGNKNDLISIPAATASVAGLVTNAAQTFAGVKTFKNNIDVKGKVIIDLNGNKVEIGSDNKSYFHFLIRSQAVNPLTFWFGGPIQTAGNITPYGNDTYTIGTSNSKWKAGYFGSGGINVSGSIIDKDGLEVKAKLFVNNIVANTANGTTYTIGGKNTHGDTITTLTIPNASTSAAGLVTNAAQTFGGHKTFTNNVYGDFRSLTSDAIGGRLLYKDPTFIIGTNNVNIYNNSGNGNVVHERVARTSDCPSNSSYMMKITTKGAASPEYGGFYQNLTSRAGAQFIIKYLIKLPVGYKLVTATNSMGSGYVDKIISDNAGTGQWKIYTRYVKCGVTGDFSSGGHLYVANNGGAAPTASAPLVWYLGGIWAYDITTTENAFNGSTINAINSNELITLNGKLRVTKDIRDKNNEEILARLFVNKLIAKTYSDTDKKSNYTIQGLNTATGVITELTIPNASTSQVGLMTATTQSFAGIKTFTNTVVIDTNSENSYNQGLRVLDASSGWATMTVGGTGTSGTSAATWLIAKNNSNAFYIAHNGCDDTVTTGFLRSDASGNWRISNRLGVNGENVAYQFYVKGTSYFSDLITANGGIRSNYYDPLSSTNATQYMYFGNKTASSTVTNINYNFYEYGTKTTDAIQQQITGQYVNGYTLVSTGTYRTYSYVYAYHRYGYSSNSVSYGSTSVPTQYVNGNSYTSSGYRNYTTRQVTYYNHTGTGTNTTSTTTVNIPIYNAQPTYGYNYAYSIATSSTTGCYSVLNINKSGITLHSLDKKMAMGYGNAPFRGGKVLDVSTGLYLCQGYANASGIMFAGNYITMWSPINNYAIKYYDTSNGSLAWSINSSHIFSGSASKLGNSTYFYMYANGTSSGNTEVNFGGSNTTSIVYFGCTAKDSKPLPTSYIFGSTTGTATVTAATFIASTETSLKNSSVMRIVSGSTMYLNRGASTSLIFQLNGSEHARFDTSGHLVPGTTNTYNIGASNKVWNAIYVKTLSTTSELKIGSNLKLWSDTEGGNIRFITPGNANNVFELDTCGNVLRLYYCTDAGAGAAGFKSWTWSTDGSFTMSGLLKVNNAPIFGYRYVASNNAPAFVWDKNGSHFTGVGSCNETDTIYFGAVSSDGNYTWVSHTQKWKFGGHIILNGNSYNLQNAGTGGTWISGRANAVVRTTESTSGSSFKPIFSAKVQGGSWDVGPCHPNTHLYFSYATDTNYNASTNSTMTSIYFTKDGYIYGSRVYNAVWNDYAEFRRAETEEPGRVVIEEKFGNMQLSTRRLQPGGSIVSDTYGHAMGETETCKTPIAVSGRVLAYPYEDRDSYEAGDAVGTGPNGTVSKMTREEIKEYPERIIGIVSEIPDYETWGQENIKVNGRIWIKIK